MYGSHDTGELVTNGFVFLSGIWCNWMNEESRIWLPATYFSLKILESNNWEHNEQKIGIGWGMFSTFQFCHHISILGHQNPWAINTCTCLFISPNSILLNCWSTPSLKETGLEEEEQLLLPHPFLRWWARSSTWTGLCTMHSSLLLKNFQRICQKEK